MFSSDDESDLNIQEEKMNRVTAFEYIGSTVADDVDLYVEVTRSLQSEWRHWKSVTGVLQKAYFCLGRQWFCAAEFINSS